MTESGIDLRKPWLAALLGFLVPGLGHAYQRRFFKAVIYFVCIVGMFFTGLQLSDWKAIQAPPFNYRAANRSLLMLKFAAQIGMGLPSMTAMLQSRRFQSETNDPLEELRTPLTAPFKGSVVYFGSGPRNERQVTGTVTLKHVQGEFGPGIQGAFTGADADGNPLELTLDHPVDPGLPIAPDAERTISASISPAAGQTPTTNGRLEGTIPRPLSNWLFVPLDDRAQQALESEKGKWLELALVLTWIAGLLNMLSIWDAFEGPAWGFNDQPDGGRTQVSVTQAEAANLPQREAVVAGS